MRLLGFI
jgi:hypothetical protein